MEEHNCSIGEALVACQIRKRQKMARRWSVEAIEPDRFDQMEVSRSKPLRLCHLAPRPELGVRGN